MFLSKRVAASVAVMALAVSLSACSEVASSDDSGGSATASYEPGFFRTTAGGTPVDGGTLTFASAAEPLTMNPAQFIGVGDSAGHPLAAVYDTLMRYDQESDAYEPLLAESLESSDDRMTWTLNLREGVTFSDGTPLDADAVIGSLEYYTTSYGYQGELITSALSKTEAVDDHTVVFTSKRRWAAFPSVLAQGPGMIMAPAAYAVEEFKPIGAGPFVVDEIQPGEHILLKARADYWDGKPHLDAVKFVPMTSQETIVDSLRSGEVQAGTVYMPQLADDVLDDDSLAGSLNYSNMGALIDINQRDGLPAADLRVRQAIALAVDPELYFERSYEGHGLPYKGIFGPGSRWFADVDETAVDLEKAKELVEAAKQDGWNGKIRFTAAADPLSKRYGQAIKAMLDRVGFEVVFDFTTGSNSLVNKVFIQHDFDLALSMRNVQEEDPHQRLRNLLYSTSTTNTLGYQSPDMDKLIDDLGAAADEAEQKELIKQIEELWREDVPAVGLGVYAYLVVWDEAVHGIRTNAVSLTSLAQAWMEKQ